MKYIILYLIFIGLISTACTPPEGLIGNWEAERKECLLTDQSILNDQFEGSDRYELSFLSDNTFKLSFFNQQFHLDKVSESGKQSQVRAKECKVSYVGTYSYNFITGLNLAFSKEEKTGGELFYQAVIEEQCGQVSEDQQLKISALPEKDFFKDDTSVIIKRVSDADLHLNFSDFEHCTNDKMTVVFQRKTQ